MKYILIYLCVYFPSYCLAAELKSLIQKFECFTDEKTTELRGNSLPKLKIEVFEYSRMTNESFLSPQKESLIRVTENYYSYNPVLLYFGELNHFYQTRNGFSENQNDFFIFKDLINSDDTPSKLEIKINKADAYAVRDKLVYPGEFYNRKVKSPTNKVFETKSIKASNKPRKLKCMKIDKKFVQIIGSYNKECSSNEQLPMFVNAFLNESNLLPSYPEADSLKTIIGQIKPIIDRSKEYYDGFITVDKLTDNGKVLTGWGEITEIVQDEYNALLGAGIFGRPGWTSSYAIELEVNKVSEIGKIKVLKDIITEFQTPLPKIDTNFSCN